MATTTAKTTSAAPLAASGRLTAKDIVLLAVFGVVTFFVMMAVAMVCSFSTDMAWWTHAIGSIPAGIVWTYLMARVPKRGAAFIAGAIMALLGFVMGMAWTGPVGILAGAALCELVMMAGRRAKWTVLVVRADLAHPVRRRVLCADGGGHGHDGRVRPGARELGVQPCLPDLRLRDGAVRRARQLAGTAHLPEALREDRGLRGSDGDGTG